MLFGKMKSKMKNPEPVQMILYEKSYVLANHFRGYKAFPMVVHGHNDAEANNERFKGMKLSGHILRFFPNFYDGKNPVYIVGIDNYIVGYIYDMNQIQEINNDIIISVYALSEPENIIGNGIVVERNRIWLFVKRAE